MASFKLTPLLIKVVLFLHWSGDAHRDPDAATLDTIQCLLDWDLAEVNPAAGHRAFRHEDERKFVLTERGSALVAMIERTYVPDSLKSIVTTITCRPGVPNMQSQYVASPVQIELLLGLVDAPAVLDLNSPAKVDALAWATRTSLIELFIEDKTKPEGTPELFTLTARGMAYVNALCNQPLPQEVKVWVVPAANAVSGVKRITRDCIAMEPIQRGDLVAFAEEQSRGS